LGDPGALSLQIKAALTPTSHGALRFGFRLEEVPAHDPSYFGLCVSFLERPIGLGSKFWLLPGEALIGGGPRRGKKIVYIPQAPGVPSKWDGYQHPTLSLAATLDQELHRRAAARAHFSREA
jgi:hypothetical protein